MKQENPPPPLKTLRAGIGLDISPTPPAASIPCCEPDAVSGKWPVQASRVTPHGLARFPRPKWNSLLKRSGHAFHENKNKGNCPAV
jgi:hypothetical protein